MNEALLVTGLALGAYPVGTIVKMIVTDINEGMIIEKKKPENVEERMDEMIEHIADCCNVSVELMKSKTRKREVAVPRQIAFYFLCKRFNKFENVALHRIGKMLNRDHATVIHSKRAIETAIEAKDELVHSLFDKCQKQLVLQNENFLLV
jgi:chromosomal replication initiation ATPase DnaA